MKTEPILSVSYSFDDLNILGVFGQDVFVKGRLGFDEDCIIKISRRLFKQSLDCWLNDKREYCIRYEDFCGAMGTIRSNECSSEGTKEILTNYYQTEKKWGSKVLRVIKVHSIDPNTDMESG